MTTRHLAMLRRRLAGFCRGQSGTATVEFVIVFPLIVSVFFSTMEAGIYATRKVMLERALNITVRALRLGQFAAPTNASLKKYLCQTAGPIIPDCLNVVLLELRPIDTVTWTLPSPAATCVDRDAKVQPLTTVVPGVSDQMMIVRACAIVNPVLPTTSLGLKMPLDPSGGYAIVATSAFVNEPS